MQLRELAKCIGIAEMLAGCFSPSIPFRFSSTTILIDDGSFNVHYL
jgi:hypothetical protein